MHRRTGRLHADISVESVTCNVAADEVCVCVFLRVRVPVRVCVILDYWHTQELYPCHCSPAERLGFLSWQCVKKKKAHWKCLGRSDKRWLNYRWNSNNEVRTLYKDRCESSTHKLFKGKPGNASQQNQHRHKVSAPFWERYQWNIWGCLREKNIPATVLYLVIRIHTSLHRNEAPLRTKPNLAIKRPLEPHQTH